MLSPSSSPVAQVSLAPPFHPLRFTILETAKFFEHSRTYDYRAALSTPTQMLSDGTVLLAGGVDTSGDALDSAEIYNPGTGTFTPLPAHDYRPLPTHCHRLDAATVLLTAADANRRHHCHRGNLRSHKHTFQPQTGLDVR